MTKRWNSVAPFHAAVLALLSGCTTTYVGQKMDVSGKLPKASSGVPFVMSKPQYKVSITADPNDATKEIYTLSADDVPDATMKFTVALDPGLWVDGKFDLDIGDSGSLAGATSTTTSRVVDTFSALVSFGIKLVATGVLDAVGTVQRYKATVGSSNAPACVAASARPGPKVRDDIVAQISQLETEAKGEIGEGKNSNTAVAELVAGRLHYLDDAQKQCMEAVLPDFEGTTQKNNFDNSVAAAKAAAATSPDKSAAEALLKTVQGLVDAGDEDGMKSLGDALRGKPEPFASVRATTAQGGQLIGAVQAGRFARSLPSMSAEVWRSRHLAYLDRKLTAARLNRLLLSNASRTAEAKAPGDAGTKAASAAAAQAANAVAALEVEWAATLGEAPTVQRIARIDNFLLTSKDLDPGQSTRRSSAAEQAGLREERDKLKAQLSQARTDLLAKNKVVALSPSKAAPAKVEPRANLPVVLATQTYVDAANKQKVTENDPEFVIVLDADTSGAIKGVKP